MAQHIMTKLTSVIPQKHQWKIDLLQRWEQILGPLAHKVKLYKIKNESIILSVTHPSWAQELHMLSDMIKSKINTVVGKDKIKNIAFNMSPPQQTFTSSKRLSTDHKTEKAPHKIVLNSKEKAALTSVGNKELRHALQQFYITCKKRQSNDSSKENRTR